ncbi:MULTISPECIES: oxygen-independent coproporphyrinogen III oxidase [unclassified Undibacterium]|uniref:oxygen-independent coproporphyrinogen III oxidase n=1 Tax=unclassified Undibacterium TaxID=2630295 RepID=UPI002AC9084D|nr:MULTISPECIES: oxygen-independent coproporphyrinogen III oxidase [unclassified Undibacterium]MEB0138080.1 oxygen-independent coproporphyrinogen III oxidase [Undibacterium sp. CCC2.1]MEB0171182.1 oxygen-independent coproporphyrinogen III oxidase [Undibacterium sp. CCC1.1]MEB0175227.1 oxygen-independent coproporphyrinogen III oxidase [Undibacterium sp. CCC3.4]MEB0214635.1 oxygen-independent coproporphyrinogen III oxidase [Undibacterium sp. 5I2]WPX42403.1 oxygen-independent coproporphyrinogen I
MNIAEKNDTVADQIDLSEALIRQFDTSGPRYTSYPTADRFHQNFDESMYLHYLGQRKNNSDNPLLSLYLHLPFCESLCYFCACNKIITQDHSRTTEYLRYLAKEIALVAEHIGPDRLTAQLHLGGGSPTFFSSDELRQLMQLLRQHFNFTEDAEIGVEIDPRTVKPETLAVLAELGFNRNSFGVQDFDPAVQQAVNRIQPYEMVEAAVLGSRQAQFQSINADLIYGLPKQSMASFSLTLDRLITLAPDRIALYNYAHLPSRFKAQRQIIEADLPSAEERLQIFMMSTRRLLEAGYVYIGLDHFSKPDDELNKARQNQTLHRNFQGYTTRADCDLIGFGVSAIGKVGHSYSQSVRTIKEYYQSLDAGHLPIEKGTALTSDDLLRREVIMTLMCSMPLDIAALNLRYQIDFSAYFASEIAALAQYEDVGFLIVTPQRISVTPKGRLFVRAVAMVFDKYLQGTTTATYSKLI